MIQDSTMNVVAAAVSADEMDKTGTSSALRKDFSKTLFSLFQPWNTTLNVTTILIAGYLGSCASAISGFPAWTWVLFGSLCYLLLLVLYDISYYAFRVPIISPKETVAHGYNLCYLLDDDGSATGDGLDYGFNYYNGDFDKPRKQAQLDKFEHAYNQLGLKAGMRLLDCGCGCGDWMMWLKTQKGVDVVGINITPNQVQHCRKRGLDVVLGDWRDIADSTTEMTALQGNFDCVSFWDTVEHYVPAQYRTNRKKQNEIYTKMFEFAHRCLKPAGGDQSPRRVWISCLHIDNTKNRTMSQLWTNYLLDKYHSGGYPVYQIRQLQTNAEDTKLFRLKQEEDLTKDYFMTSVLEPSHFGKMKFTWISRIPYLLVNTIADPNWLQRLAWHLTEAWMDQFDGDDWTRSPQRLLWLLFEATA